MTDGAEPAADLTIEAVMRDELARGDALIGTIAPILRHLIANDDHSVFSDEIIARVRGMLGDVARQLLDAASVAAGETERPTQEPEAIEALVMYFVTQSALLAHTHALALEWQLTERLQARLALDPVLSPLLQALIASDEPGTATAAMALLASQARFAQAQRRMELPLGELPGDLLHLALQAFSHSGADAGHATAAERTIRAQFDEARGRIGLISRLVMGMGGGATAALAIDHAGVAIFLSAMALGSGQDRDLAVLATNESQVARLALGLRAGGLRPAAISEQFATMHPQIELPARFDGLGSDRAVSILAGSAADASG